MKLSLELLDVSTPEELLEDAEKECQHTLHRYKPEPTFSKTGVGSLSPTSIEERVKEGQRSTEQIRKLKERHARLGKTSEPNP